MVEGRSKYQPYRVLTTRLDSDGLSKVPTHELPFEAIQLRLSHPPPKSVELTETPNFQHVVQHIASHCIASHTASSAGDLPTLSSLLPELKDSHPRSEHDETIFLLLANATKKKHIALVGYLLDQQHRTRQFPSQTTRQ